MTKTAVEHYDEVKTDLRALHAMAAVAKAEGDGSWANAVNRLHVNLGHAWDDYRAEHGDGSEEQARRDGGHDKPPEEPPEPGDGG